jgi:hypothetical protein
VDLEAHFPKLSFDSGIFSNRPRNPGGRGKQHVLVGGSKYILVGGYKNSWENKAMFRAK